MLALFQPHLYSRTRHLAHGFAVALADADAVVRRGHLPAREQPIAGVSGRMIVDALAAAGPACASAGRRALEDAARIVAGWARPATSC